MKRNIILLVIFLGLISGLWLHWQAGGDRWPETIPEVAFTPMGSVLHFSADVQIERVRVRTADGLDQLDLYCPEVRRRSLWLYWSWQPGTEYEFVVWTAGHRWSLKKKSGNDPPTAGVILAAPYTGLEREDDARYNRKNLKTSIGVIAKAEVTGALLVTNYLPGGADYQGEIVFPDQVRAMLLNHNDDAAMGERDGHQVLGFKTRLASTGAKYNLIFKLIPRDESDYRLQARVRYHFGEYNGNYQRVVEVGQSSIDQLAKGLNLENVVMPAGPTGLKDWKKQADTIFYKPPLFNQISKMLGFDPVGANPWFPYTFQTIKLENLTDRPMTLLIHSKILYQDSDTAPPAFWPSQIFSGTMRDNSVVVGATVEAGQTSQAVIPVFVTGQPDPGLYRRVLSIVPTGFDRPLKTITLPLHVSTMNYRALGFTLGSMIFSLGALLFFSFSFGSLFAGWKVRWVVIIALFGAVSFTVVNLPLRIFGSFINAVLGPFSVFIIGFFNDLLHYTLLVALLRLIPGPGVMTLFSLVRFFLSGFMTGFHILEILLTGTSIAATEGGLYLSGLTRQRQDFQWTWKSAAILALILGMTGVYLTATGIYLHMLLFRLYFADWYIYLSILLNGFVFTVMGVMLGKKFSDRLIWAED